MQTSIVGERPPLGQQAADMVSEGGAVWPQDEVGTGTQATPYGAGTLANGEPLHLEATPRTFSGFLEDVSRRWGRGRLRTLFAQRGRVSESMGCVPNDMHRLASQTQLVLELIDDFREGIYRDISWRSIALLVGGVLYAVNPAEVIPDAVPVLGSLDDLAVLAVVTRMVTKDLRKYCSFKGYPIERYFRD